MDYYKYSYNTTILYVVHAVHNCSVHTPPHTHNDVTHTSHMRWKEVLTHVDGSQVYFKTGKSLNTKQCGSMLLKDIADWHS